MQVRQRHHLKFTYLINEGLEHFLHAEFSCVGGKTRKTILPAASRAKPGDVLRELYDAGFSGNGTADALPDVKAALAALAQQSNVLRLVDANGYIGTEAFAFGRTIIPASARGKFVLRRAIESAERFEQAGTVDGWKAALLRPCSHSPLTIFSVCTPAAAVLLDIFEKGVGLGFHYAGESGAGKSWLLAGAKSVQDSPNFKGKSGVMPSGDLTAAALEELAARFNHLLLPIDELGATSPEEMAKLITKLAYQIRDGRGRTRSKLGSASVGHGTLGYAVAVIINGEKPLVEVLGKRKRNPGEIFRLIDIAVPSPSSGGIFPGVNPELAGKLFAETSAALKENHGVVLPRLIGWLVRNRAANEAKILANVENQIIRINQRFAGHGQQRRFVHAFAKVHVAGQLLVHLKLAPFDRKALDAAIDYVFERALMAITEESAKAKKSFGDHQNTLNELRGAIRDPKQFPQSENYLQAIARGQPVKGFIRRYPDGNVVVAVDPSFMPKNASRAERTEFWAFLDAKGLIFRKPNGPWTRQTAQGKYPRGADGRPRWLLLKYQRMMGTPAFPRPAPAAKTISRPLPLKVHRPATIGREVGRK